MALRPLKKAVKLAGSPSALAAQIGRKQSTVWDWLNIPGRKVPPECAKEIEQATKGQVTRHDLRPDLFDAPPIQAPAELRAAE